MAEVDLWGDDGDDDGDDSGNEDAESLGDELESEGIAFMRREPAKQH